MNKALELAATVEESLDFLIRKARDDTWEGFVFQYEEDAEVFASRLRQLRALSDEILSNVTQETDDVG